MTNLVLAFHKFKNKQNIGKIQALVLEDWQKTSEII